MEKSPRTTGITELFHTLDMYTMSSGVAKGWLQKFSWENPPPNPNEGMFMRLKATFWNLIRKHEAYHDSARRFGLLPIHIQATATGNSDQMVFHILFTSMDSMNMPYTWQLWRSVESIFHHHASAKVIVHSNDLMQSEFDVLTEVGYAIEVHSYSVTHMLLNTPAESMIGERLVKASRGQYWYSHKIELLKVLILYKYGGVCVDTDMIMVRPLGQLFHGADSNLFGKKQEKCHYVVL